VSGSWSIRLRIPGWTANPVISVNGAVQNVTAAPGSYATVTRTWAAGDTITVRLPMRVIMKAANDNPTIQAITYGPAVLSGNYGNTALSSSPSLTVSSITRTSTSSLAFTATANGAAVNLGPFHDAQGFNYNVYWNTGGAGTATYKLVNVGTGLVLGVQNMSTADGGPAVVWGDTGTADHRWTLVANSDGSYRIRNVNSGKVLAILNGSSTWGTQAVQESDNGSADNNWRLVQVS
jgi:hypothetical protein